MRVIAREGEGYMFQMLLRGHPEKKNIFSCDIYYFQKVFDPLPSLRDRKILILHECKHVLYLGNTIDKSYETYQHFCNPLPPIMRRYAILKRKCSFFLDCLKKEFQPKQKLLEPTRWTKCDSMSPFPN